MVSRTQLLDPSVHLRLKSIIKPTVELLSSAHCPQTLLVDSTVSMAVSMSRKFSVLIACSWKMSEMLAWNWSSVYLRAWKLQTLRHTSRSAVLCICMFWASCILTCYCFVMYKGAPAI